MYVLNVIIVTVIFDDELNGRLASGVLQLSVASQSTWNWNLDEDHFARKPRQLPRKVQTEMKLLPKLR